MEPKNIANQIAATQTLTITVGPDKVWDALINPEIIKQYLFGTNAISDWKEGSPLRFTGVWEGKEYTDKGTILKFEPLRRLRYSYWSSFSGLADVPENYMTVTFDLTAKGNETTLTVLQEGTMSEQARDHSQENWKTVLTTMKKILEETRT